MSADQKVPDWVTRGKTIAGLIKELQSFENQNLEVRISTDNSDSHFPISLVGRQDGACVLMSAAEGYDPAHSPSVRPDELDALVAAPEHHTLIFENEHVRVLETLIPPGEKTAVHTHCWPAVLYFLSRGHFVRRDGSGNVMLDSRAQPAQANPPTATWTPPFPPHSLENVGTTDIRVIAIELKRATS